MKTHLQRKGPEGGWIWGGTGGLLWIPVLGAIFLFKGMVFTASVSFLLFAAGVFYLFRFAPWKYPDTPLWKISLGFVALLILSAVVIHVLWAAGTTRGYGGLGKMVYLLLILLVPVFTVGNRTWREIAGGKRK
jgi:hypothetical protein